MINSSLIMTLIFCGLSIAPIAHANGALTPESPVNHTTSSSTESIAKPPQHQQQTEISSLRNMINDTKTLIITFEQKIEKYNGRIEALEKIASASTKKQADINAKAKDHTPSSKISYEVWTSILLACVAIIVTVLGVAIAILAFIGYKTTIRKASELASEAATEVAKATAADIARKEITERIDDGSFNDLIEDAVDKVTFKGIGAFPGSNEDGEGES